MFGNEKNKKRFAGMAVVIVCLAFGSPQAGAGTGWGELPYVTERQKLLASDGAAQDYFGNSVSISGDYAIIGVRGDDNQKGSAYVFWWDGTGYTGQQKLTASDGATWDIFGCSVSVSGDYAIVGAVGDDNETGSAYVFIRNGTSWLEQHKLTASDGFVSGRFGGSVSISGDHAIVGTYGPGSAYVFRWDGTSWIEQKLTASDGAAGDYFGCSVSINGDYAIVGSYSSDDGYKGSAYVFKWDGTSWTKQQKLTASDGAAGDHFGDSVSISGELAIVGAYGDDDKGDQSGSAYIFRWNGASWAEQQKLTASDGDANDCFGWSVSISGYHAIVGSKDDDSRKGSAYIFEWGGAGWAEQRKLLASDGAVIDEFGRSVCISDDHAIAGACQDDLAKGSVYAFKFCPKEDLNGDSKVDFVDFAMFADSWLYGTE